MIGKIVVAVQTGFFGAFDGGLKVTILQVFQHFAEVAGRPLLDAVFINVFDLFKNWLGRVVKPCFHKVVLIIGFSTQI